MPLSTTNSVLKYLIMILISTHLCRMDDDIHISSTNITIKDKNSLFQQSIDIKNLNNMTVCYESSSTYCLKWGNPASTQFNISVDNVCKNYEYKSTTLKSLKISFNTSGIHIYGGAEQNNAVWPIEKSIYEQVPYVSSNISSQAVLEPFWLFNTGHYVYVEKNVPLFINMNKSAYTFDLIAQNSDPYLSNNITILKYKICEFKNMKLALQHAFHNVLALPTQVPDKEMVLNPVFSTWVKFKTDIDQKKVLNYAQDIYKNQKTASQIEIDDKWEICYGSLTVDEIKFPDMKGLVQALWKMKFRTTIWVHPFINLDCQPFYEEAKTNGYFVQSTDGNFITEWWNGKGSHIDFTNVNASNWYRQKLENLKTKYGINSFKFDAGESSWLPQKPVFKKTNNYPEENLKAYVKFASTFNKLVEVRVGRGTQNCSTYVRMLDRESSWNGNLGLTTLIPTLLQMNIIGYPYVLPDMVGGNQYNNETISEELFIRWLQVNLFMPSIQFSVPPWDLGSNVTTIATKLLRLREKFTNNILHAMKIAVQKGTPVNPPIWWIDPNDTNTHDIDSEFLVGESMLIAPILQEGAVKRDIYLPKGMWKDENHKSNKHIQGPKWLYNYSADINTVPYFMKITAPPSPINQATVLPKNVLCVLVLISILFYC